MTEIKIEKKKSYWPWALLGILALAIIVYLTFFRVNEPGTGEEQTVVLKDTASTTFSEDAIPEYIAYISSNENAMGPDHTYSSNAIRQLTEATRAIAAKARVDINDNLHQVGSLADRITVDPQLTTHADSIKTAAVLLSSALQQVQQSGFPGLDQEANKVIASAKAIKPGELTLDQKTEVKDFFKDAADLLEKMNNTSTNEN